MVVAEIEFLLRSSDASWCYDKWEQLPADGNRYEVIDGVLYMSTSPSFRHQRSVMRLDRNVGVPLEAQGIAIAVSSPIGVFMHGADPVLPAHRFAEDDECQQHRDDEAELVDRLHLRDVPEMERTKIAEPRQASGEAGEDEESWLGPRDS